LIIQGTTTDCVIPNGSAFATGIFRSLSTPSTTITISNPTNTSIITIGDYAFSKSSGTPNTAITSVTIPSTIATIGASAFQYCSNLGTINLGYTTTPTGFSVGIDAFSNISATLIIQGTTTNCVIPNGSYFATGIFTSLSTPSTTITISNPTNTSIITIGVWAFSGSSGTPNTAITALTIPSSVTNIGASAFQYCSNLGTINLGYTTTPTGFIVDTNAFSNINATVTIQGTTTNCIIPDFMFARTGNTSLSTSTTIIIATTTTPTSTSIIKIGDYAFSGIQSITALTIPSSVTTIGRNAFTYCPLGTINLGYTSTPTGFSVGIFAFSNIMTNNLIIQGTTTNCVIPDGMFTSLTDRITVTISNPTNTSIITIGNYAFSGSSGTPNTAITSVTIPSTIATIGASAFQYCSALTALTIPSSVTSIGTSAFQYCSNLGTINLGYTTTPTVFSVGTNAFSNISATLIIQGTTTNCVIPNGSTIATGIFTSLSTPSTTITISNPTNTSIITIGDYAFSGSSGTPNTAITSVTIPSTIATIGASAFQSCTSITALTIPSSVATIGASAFQSCTSITALTIPSSVTNIGISAFQYCSNLGTINLGYKTTPTGFKVRTNAFSDINATLIIQGTTTNCVIPNSSAINTGIFSSLSTPNTTITISNPTNTSIITIGDYAFSGYSSTPNTAITSVKIPNTVTSIGTSAFQLCYNLNMITMPSQNSITTVNTNAFTGVINVLINTDMIPPSMFLNDTSLNSVYFTNNVTCISANAFNGCTGLTYINLNNVNNIGENAFNGCNSLKKVVSYPTSLTLANNVFSSVNNTSATIYTNEKITTNLNPYFKTIISPTNNIPYVNTIPHTVNNQSLYNVVSLYGNTYNISSSVQNVNYGIPQTTNSSGLNYINLSNTNSTLLPGLQYVIYNKSGVSQYIQFYPYCNCTNSSGSTGASVTNVFSISNNICTIQPNCVICFIYVGKTDFSSYEGYITGYAHNII
jgi:hypothetical protein